MENINFDTELFKSVEEFANEFIINNEKYRIFDIVMEVNDDNTKNILNKYFNEHARYIIVYLYVDDIGASIEILYKGVAIKYNSDSSMYNKLQKAIETDEEV